METILFSDLVADQAAAIATQAGAYAAFLVAEARDTRRPSPASALELHHAWTVWDRCNRGRCTADTRVWRAQRFGVLDGVPVTRAAPPTATGASPVAPAGSVLAAPAGLALVPAAAPTSIIPRFAQTGAPELEANL